ncbi:hypothetical protein HD554DRAFT_2177499 [Boletus coccyginus]|nr:hypothetical protein HD554DRAFT_2177499 [Boletus coccyginus]
MTHDKVLVTNEYRVASQALETDAYKSGVYVLGQPGIGETLFLVYLTVLRLGRRQPVSAVQSLTGKGFYAFFKDTVCFHSLDVSKPLEEGPSVWALCDSHDDVKTPDGLFKCHRHVRIIQTTSPEPYTDREFSYFCVPT